ncbi:MAG TPA: hypothetical protein VFU21_16620 [Kofleriaceae bacterium]|nr:hypothetical protein [Kofleriaceae bacterium]
MRRLTAPLFAAAALAVTAGTAAADTIETVHQERDGWAVGYTLHRFQDDFGTGASLSTPRFLRGSLRVTLGGGVSWSPHAVTADGDQDWARYGGARLVLEGGARAEGSPVRLYGFGGPMLLALPSRLSDDELAVGGIGGFGFEYYFMKGGQDGPVSYFTELGGAGTGARADNQPGRPMLANGFFVTVGLRWTL